MKYMHHFLVGITLFTPSLAFAEDAEGTTKPHALTTGAASPATVSDRHGDVDAEDHGDHTGFMLRLATGPAGMATAIETADGTIEAEATGMALEVQVGASVLPNLMLHSDLMIVGTTEDDVDVRRDAGPNQDGDGLALGGLGVGATYFFMPYNVSVTSSVLFAVSSLDTGAEDELSSDYGVMGKFSVTKEWMLSHDWGMGVGGSFFGGYSRGEDASNEDFDAAYAGASINLVATYN